MRRLVVLRGLPGSGKSTFIKEHHLDNYTLCPDNLRLLFNGPTLDLDGDFKIPQDKNGKVFELLYELLEQRMMDGEFTVIDGTNLTNRDFKQYKKLAKKYRYRLYCIDFSDIPYETVLERNNNREPLKIVSKFTLDKMKTRMETSSELTGIKVLKPEEFEKVLMSPIDLSKYNKIHHFGDIHGCYTVLKEYFDKNGGIKEDEYYIFCGDYIDRGVENAEVLKFLFSIKDLPNIQFLQGNHECHLLKYINGEKAKSTEFNEVTRKELEFKDITKKDISIFTKKLTQCAYYNYNGKIIIATHGGLSNIPDNLVFVPTKQMIKGVGKYSEYLHIAKTFTKNTAENTYQVNGHRNVEYLPLEVEETRCFNLEGGVEQGKCLRVLTLDKNGFHPIEIQNTVFKKQENQLLFDMKHNLFVKEKKFDEISSFNFTRDAFNKGVWNAQTIKARGLYLNNSTGEVVCRGYNKFFAVDEMKDTSIGAIKSNYIFPLTAYVKENGFLGLVSYREKTDDLFITTKSDPTGDYAKWFKELLCEYDTEKLKNYVKEQNSSCVFEVIDIKNDPHIIKYDKSQIVLLDIIENTTDEFKRKSYEDLCEFAKEFHFKVKEKAFVINDFSEFMKWYNLVNSKNYKYDNQYIEGFVFEDSENKMCKIKTSYYKMWKYLRGRIEVIKKYNLSYEQVKCNSNILNYQEINSFLKWYCENRNEITEEKIIDIREKYLS